MAIVNTRTAPPQWRHFYCMTTTLRNVSFQGEITLFNNKKLPATPIAVLYAMKDCLVTREEGWIRSDEAKALMHTLNMSVYGPNYQINATQEQKTLERIFPKK